MSLPLLPRPGMFSPTSSPHILSAVWKNERMLLNPKEMARRPLPALRSFRRFLFGLFIYIVL